MLEHRARNDSKGVWEGTQKGCVCVGVGLCCLARSLGVKAAEKGMALVCSGDSFFLEKGIGKA